MSAYIYVVEFDQGTVKVGQTTKPEERMRGLMWDANKFGISVLRHWTSDEHMGAFLNEKTLIEWCSDRAKKTHGKEWFTGLTFDEVKGAAIFILANDGMPPA